MATKKSSSTNKKPDSTTNQNPEFAQLYRSETNRVVAGVAGGLGEYFKVDPVLIRLILLLLVMFGGSGLPIYIILWVLLPNKSKLTSSVAQEDTMRENIAEIGHQAKTWAGDVRAMPARKSRKWFGGIVVALALVILLDQFTFINLSILFPLFVLGIGLYLLLN